MVNEHLPDRFTIVCTRSHPDAPAVVHMREVDLDRGIMRRWRKSWQAGDDRFRLGSTELRCPNPSCETSRRLSDEDLDALIGSCCQRAISAESAVERSACLRVELAGIDAILRAIR